MVIASMQMPSSGLKFGITLPNGYFDGKYMEFKKSQCSSEISTCMFSISKVFLANMLSSSTLL